MDFKGIDLSRFKDVDRGLIVEDAPRFLLGPLKLDGNKVWCLKQECGECDIFEKCQTADPVSMLLGHIPNIRRVFLPHPGNVFVSIDYSGVEVRISANLAGESVWIKAFNSGGDIHRATAASMFNKTVEQISPYERKVAKAGTFCALYGGSASTMAANAGISQARGEEAFKQFFAGLSGLKKWMTEQQEMAQKNMFTSTYFGRRRNLAPYYQDGSGKMAAYANRTSLNHPIQGTAADIMKIALVKVKKAIFDNGIQDDCKLLMTIHDELDFEITEGKLDEIIPILVDTMTMKISAWPVPLTVDVEVGPNWGEISKYIPPGNPSGSTPESTVGGTPSSTDEEQGEQKFADVDWSGINFTRSLIYSMKKAAVRSPGDQVLRLRTNQGVYVLDALGKIDRRTFLEKLV